MKVLLTGSSGFIGSRLFGLLNQKGILVKEVSLQKTDIKDIVFSKIETVIHLSALVHQKKNTVEKKYYEINRDNTIELAIASKANGVSHFIYYSTIKVLGEETLPGNCYTEKCACNPVSPYGKSKYEAELGLQGLESDTFKVSIIRPPLVYGPGVKGNVKELKRLIETFPILPLGGINNCRSMVSIDNLCLFTIKVIEKRFSGIFHITDSVCISTSELVNMICTASHKKLINFRLPNYVVFLIKKIIPNIYLRLWGDLCVDSSATKKLFNFNNIFLTNDEIEKMITEERYNG